MEPHRAPLGGEEHSTEAPESFRGDDTTVEPLMAIPLNKYTPPSEDGFGVPPPLHLEAY